MHLLNPTGLLKLSFDQTAFKEQKHPFTKFQGWLFQIWILILLILLISVLLILKLKKRFGLIWVKLQNG